MYADVMYAIASATNEIRRFLMRKERLLLALRSEIQARRDNNAPKNEISRERLENFTRNNNVASAITSFPWLSVTRKYRVMF